MGVPGLVLLALLALAATGRCAPRDALACSQGLACRLLDADALCSPPAWGSGPVPARLRLEPALRCAGPAACAPCVRAHLGLALPLPPARRRAPAALLLLWGHAYGASRCVAVEVRALPPAARPNGVLGWLTFQCFEAPLGSELRVTTYGGARSRLSRSRRVPDCSWPAAQAAVPQCRAPRLQVLHGPRAAVVRLQEAAPGHNYTLRLYHNRSRGAGGSGRTVAASSTLNYSLPADEVLPCLCLQVWPEAPDPPRVTSCPFSDDAAAWERLWAQSRLQLHVAGDSLSCAVSSPCDLPAQLVPCWRPGPAGPCQALPLLLPLPAAQVPQEFPALRPHPSLCVQARSGSEARITQCLQDRALPGRNDDLLLVETNASLCALQRGACTPLDAFTTAGWGRPGLLAPRLRQDVALGRCAPLWRHNGTGAALWACPLRPYVRARWALGWLAALLGAACALLLLLLTKDRAKAWLRRLRGGDAAGPRARRALLLHAAEPAAERAACALAAALRPLGLAAAAAPGGGVEAAARGTLPWLHALHARALRDGDVVVLLLSAGAAAAARHWDGDSDDDGDDVAPCEAFAAALSCAVPALSARGGRHVVARLEAAVPAVPRLLRGLPTFALPMQADALLRALARPPRRMEPLVARAAARLRRALAEPQ